MRNVAFALAAIGGIVAAGNAEAGDIRFYSSRGLSFGGHGHHHNGYTPHFGRHSRFHDELDHRAFHRDLYHREAHRYPMTWRQHGRLHDHLEHDAFHDRLEHRQYHRAYPSHGYGRRFGGGGLYLHFGH
ncbi:MAG TPA: hypothetical protein VML55_06115 [Planctomycetaceae bacterium]|nr:hypothetical protein [Planctomycetaceae bacterium]